MVKDKEAKEREINPLAFLVEHPNLHSVASATLATMWYKNTLCTQEALLMSKPDTQEDKRTKIPARQGEKLQMIEQLPRVRFTPKQRLFIEAYLVSRSLTKAAIAAGCKERSAHAVGWKWFKKAAIRAEIEARLASTLDRYAITSARIMRELALIAFGNVGDFFAVQDDGSLVVDLGTATREQMASLKSIEIDERPIAGAAAGVRRIKISLSDKRQALMDLAKIARMLPADRLEHSGSVEYVVPQEHKIDIESMTPEEREQLRKILLTAAADKAV
jgi:phage terminase small subunit